MHGIEFVWRLSQTTQVRSATSRRTWHLPALHPPHWWWQCPQSRQRQIQHLRQHQGALTLNAVAVPSNDPKNITSNSKPHTPQIVRNVFAKNTFLWVVGQQFITQFRRQIYADLHKREKNEEQDPQDPQDPYPSVTTASKNQWSSDV